MTKFPLVKFVLLLYLTFYTELGLAEDYVGCLFSKHVCEDFEVCYNDDAFGKCISHYTSDQDHLFKYDLMPSELLLLQKEMERLYSEEYKWNNKYTQCIVQTILEAQRYGSEYDPKMCNEKLIEENNKEENPGQLTPEEIEEILSAKEMAEEVSPYDVAYIKFEPSIREGLKEFADEIFSPLGPDAMLVNENVRENPSKKDGLNDKQISSSTLQKLLALEYLKQLSQSQSQKNDKEEMELNNDRVVDGQAQLSGYDEGSMGNSQNEFSDNSLNYNKISESKKSEPKSIENDTVSSKDEQKNNDKDFIDFYELWDQPSSYDYELGESGHAGNNMAVQRNDPNMFSTFQRWDRLDTKKPGPDFPQHGQPREEDILSASKLNMQENQDESKLLNELIHEVHQDSSNPESSNNKIKEATSKSPSTVDGTTNVPPYIPVRIPVAKKKQARLESEVLGAPKTASNTSKEEKKYDAVQSSYAYLLVDKKIENRNEGTQILKVLEKLLQLPSETFTDIKIDSNQITFKVNSNPKQMNASQVADKAESFSSEIEKEVGFVVQSTGIGDEVKLEVARKNQGQFAFILAFVLVGIAFGILVAAVVVYVVRRHARTKAKLRNISNQDTEASHDYEDLCRQRMASKTSDKPEPIHVAQAQRISSLSQSEGSAASPTSRSSTSSWSEEPVSSNMDISTGHVILSYMEDHLKNKDRLDREWEALCAYEAEPCSTDCATAPNHIKKNRFPNVIPYDHSRVVLMETTNINGSNYINASTITDHDPRTPAYIATQGPLPHTAADFWQMVWEQGSVVIVMLTRLMENGVALCHRYWPEEGSELYHIYEVHLVSEHIWCDDYLIRSFYLKNLKTSETRTVTQFHFLSWPENGVPPSIKALLEFRRKVNKSFRGRSCPIITHCSDGSGRTGTYCLIDMVLNRMDKGAKEIDIAATLEHIRDQRVAMVKTKAQFEFVLMAIAEEVHAILKAMPQ